MSTLVICASVAAAFFAMLFTARAITTLLAIKTLFIGASIAATVFVLVMLRIYIILPRRPAKTMHRRRTGDTCSLAVFLGSGGHTAEAITLLESLDFSRYTPRTYFVAEAESRAKALRLEERKASTTNAKIYMLPRARRLRQSWLTTPFTVLRTLLTCMRIVNIPSLRGDAFAEVLILNGPGTCVPLCLAVYINKFFGLSAPRLIYVESFARVQTLSLSGKFLRPLVDRFIVQWPDLVKDAHYTYCGCFISDGAPP